MDKSVLISEILPKLSRMGIAYTSGQGTDVTISCEFLEAGWGTGNKKINYTALAYFDESENTVYMWELTKEIGAGFSFGGDSETSFQSGTTLFRKVKSVQYGPDGKAYEYTLDLGAIPKAFKETAKSYGWKFKTVLKCDKASYLPGNVPTANVKQQPGNAQVPPVNMNLQQDHASNPPPPPVSDADGQANYIPEKKYSNPNDAFYAKGSKSKSGVKGVLYCIGLILLVLFTALMFSYSKNSIIGWGLAAGLLILMFLLRRPLTKKGCLIEIIIWVAALTALSLIFAFTIGESSEDSAKKADTVKQASAENTPTGNAVIGGQSFSREYNFPDGKGTFIIDMESEGKEGPYTIIIKGRFNNSGLPGGFKYDASMTDEKVEIWSATDFLTFAVCSSKEASEPGYINPTHTFTEYNSELRRNELEEYTEFEGELSFQTRKDVLDFTEKNDTLQVLWYNLKEVGLRDIEKREDGSMSATHNHEKSFGLHPPLASANIPWTEIVKGAGL